ncbi:hypothetical protein BDZ97DRAFT_1918608 [Flammula alnicola]|nr:hypothetical protein BDZ97DRAFT_1918608 [Flammula alnicola]
MVVLTVLIRAHPHLSPDFDALTRTIQPRSTSRSVDMLGPSMPDPGLWENAVGQEGRSDEEITHQRGHHFELYGKTTNSASTLAVSQPPPAAPYTHHPAQAHA